jgi:anti-sigma B factor antagonist
MADAHGGSGGASEPFQARLERRPDTIVIIARGEIDLASSGQLDERFREALDTGVRRVVLDLREVLFIESTGLGAILTMNRAASAADIAFDVVRGPGTVHRLFEITQTDQVLRFIEAHEIEAS